MTEASSERSFAVGSVVAGKLRIVRRLGIGGMGAVYEVEHLLTRHRRALKLLHPQMAEVPVVVERFLREASVAGRIGNPHIVETFDAGTLDTGEPYIVMELLQGQTLAEVLRNKGPLEIVTACNILTQACNAMQAAHAAGIVHRDLKPENLFMTGTEGSFVKVLDFGISKFDSALTGAEGLTLDGAAIGTPYYMSPEQVAGDTAVDARTDIYALGVVLYECVTGSKPFQANSLPQLASLVSRGVCRIPSELRPALPKALDTIIGKAMALNRSERYRSASELGDAVAAVRHSLVPPASASESESPQQSVDKVSRRTGETSTSGESRPHVSAQTPDVFSKSAPTAGSGKLLHRQLRWLSAGLGLLALSAAAWGVVVASNRSALRKSEHPATTVAEPEQDAAPAVLPAVTPTQPRAASLDVPPQALPPAVTLASPPLVAVVPTNVESPAVASASKPPGAPPPPASRASSHGLSVKNPFR